MGFNIILQNYNNFNPFGFNQSPMMPSAYNNFNPFGFSQSFMMPFTYNSIFSACNTQFAIMNAYQYGAMLAANMCKNSFAVPQMGFNFWGNNNRIGSNSTTTTNQTNNTDKSDNTSSTSAAKGNEVADGTSIAVSGVDYSIFDKPDKIKQLRPEMQKKVEQLYKYAKNKGWKITLTSGFRDPEKQRNLYNLWKAGKHKAPAVAKPGTSRHEYGCAVDLRINGKGSCAELLELGKYAKTIGVRQGLSFGEQWHFDINPKTTPKGRKTA